MKFFGQLVRTVVNTVSLPVAVTKDIFTLGGVSTGRQESYTKEAVEKLKEEAKED